MSSGISDFRYDSHMSERAELNSEQVHSERLPEPVPTIRKRNWPEIIIATGAVMTFCYFAEWELAVVLISILLAFILTPVVDLLTEVPGSARPGLTDCGAPPGGHRLWDHLFFVQPGDVVRGRPAQVFRQAPVHHGGLPSKD